MYELKKKGIPGIFFILIFAAIIFAFFVFVKDGIKYDSPKTTTTTTTQSANQDGENQPGETNGTTPNGGTEGTTNQIGTNNGTTTPVTTTNGNNNGTTPSNGNPNGSTTPVTTRGNNSSKTNKATTRRTTATKKTTIDPSTVIVGTREVTNLIDQQSKYGVLIKTYEVVYYTMYGDGRETEADRKREVRYDHSGYNGTTNSLVGEARTVASANNAINNEILNIVNGYRRDAGVPPLVIDNSLSESATVRALEMGYADYYDPNHIRPNGSAFYTVFSELNISYMKSAENIAMGQRSASQVCTAWFNSQGHRENMLNPDYTKIGIGYFKFNNNTYWVQHFTN